MGYSCAHLRLRAGFSDDALSNFETILNRENDERHTQSSSEPHGGETECGEEAESQRLLPGRVKEGEERSNFGANHNDETMILR